jgi:hypothetical protein
MIDFTRSKLSEFIIHFVGNKGLGEELTLSNKKIQLSDEFIKDTVVRYLTSPFKNDIYYQFKSKNEMNYHDVKSYVDDLFNKKGDFIEASQKIAEHLYNQSMHPKIKGGEFYTCYFNDCNIDGVICDAIGLFKTENKDTYLKVFQHMDNFDVECDNGININKLDKGCIIFNTENEKGYKISIIDTNNKIADCAFYWVEDFLNTKLKENGYFHTSNFIETCKGFCEEVLTEENNVKKEDQMMLLNKSTGFFKEKDKFNIQEFEKEVLPQAELQEAFRDYRKTYNDKMDLTAIDDFEISPTAVKKNQKFMKSVIKLDKNFHVYVHGRHDYVEKGYDEEKGLKFYKLFYSNENYGN